ncbi:hypothetical protein [Nocardioides sp. InS609-2]|uniref:hypothetical protein n=1 Tax=Nocardioides sp. InS609-2 TaxID=2760705 RepID=UPI0020C01DBE|nr:hypothetical protein [Nocardioides sp. InS609-2]
MAEVYGTLKDLNLPEDVIDEVMKMLDENADALEKRNVHPISEDVFGSSSWGSQLGFDAGLAQDVVAKAVVEMVAGLRGYHDGLKTFVDDVKDTDESNAATLKALELSTQHVDTPALTLHARSTPAPEGEA